MIYLDNASTTKIDPRVLEEMMPYLKESYGNPGNLHLFGREARDAVDKARRQVADFLGVKDARCIVFTASGTEANNMVFNSFGQMNEIYDVLISSIEHDSVIKAAGALEGQFLDRRVYKVKPTDKGVITLENLEKVINEDCLRTYTDEDGETIQIVPTIGLVSVMYMNNETGMENPVAEIGHYCNEKGILYHCDAVQAASCLPIDVDEIGCDFLSISGHKIYGPKGIGALYIRDFEKFSPLIRGGSRQERGLRGGTENVPGIVGLGAACQFLKDDMEEDNKAINEAEQAFIEELLDGFARNNYSYDILHLNGGGHRRVYKTINLRVDGIDAETMMLVLDSMGVCVSAGSACSSREQKPSRVLLEMGLTPEEAREGFRISFSKYTLEEEAIAAARKIVNAIMILGGN